MSRPPISGRTGLCGLIGDPVSHSLSPALHNAAYEALGCDLQYLAFSVAVGDVARALVGAKALGFVGLSATTPHKDALAAACDQWSPEVELLGAANTVVFRQGISIASSTDGEGLLDDLGSAFSFSPEGRRCAVIGAGGAARSVVLALAGAGAAEVAVVNRTPERALAAAALAGGAGRVAERDELEGFELVVNATSLGLEATEASASASAALAAPLHVGQLVVDLVYVPAVTPFLVAAEKTGATVRNGLGMLVHQAARQVELFSGCPAPLDAMWEAVGGRS